MKAAVFYGPNDMRVEERPIPAPAENELLLKVGACAICGSDLRTFRFGAGNITGAVVIGHEVAGTIAEVGTSLRGYNLGDRVAVAPAVPCDECPFCLRGLHTMCDNLRSIGYQFDGGFADYMIVPWSAVQAGCVNPVPDGVSIEEATLAEPLACAINAQELLNVGPGDTVVILGAGPMGCMHASLARIRGASRVFLADIREERLKLAAPFGVDVLIDSSREDVKAKVLEETRGSGASVVIVAAPSGEAQEQALTMAAKHGRISFFGGLPKTSPFVSVNANLIHYRELFVMGAYGSMPRHNRLALELLAGGRIQSDSLIGLVVPLDRIADGFDAVAQGKVLKALVRPSV
jgi:L-iditol 2-dehydrogenase